MSFRARIALVSATAVALAVVIASIVVYFVVRGQLLSSLDGSIRERTTLVLSDPGRAFFAPGPFGVQGYVQVVGANGACQAKGNQACLVPVTRDAREVARGEKEAYFSAANASDPDHTHLRILTIHVPGTSAAVQVARPLTEVDHSLSRIRWYLILIAVGGAAVAAGLGLLVSRAALAPVRRLTGSDGARGGDGRPVRADRRARGGRAQPARGELQHDARSTRRIPPRPAAARRGCLARAADAAHEPAHEYRGAGKRTHAASR